MIEQTTVISRSSNLLETEIDDEVVALDVAKGLCYGLDTIGSEIWRLLEHETTADAICSKLTGDYNVSRSECMRDVLGLLNQLEQDGLVFPVASELHSGKP